VPPLPGGGERAFVANATGLVEVSTAGGSQIVAPLASWCNVDARANVVWFATSNDLHAFDLIDRRVRTVVHGSYANDLEPIIDWGSEQLGGESKVLFDVGAALRLGRSNPELEVVMGCEGDRAPFCFGDDDETPTDSVTRLQRQASALRISDPAYLTQLARRGAHASLWPPPPVPPAPPKRKPVTDRKACTEVLCGTLIAIPASPLWLVVTASSRDDYYHETRELWDPATGEYIRRNGDRMERFKAPRNESGRSTDYRGLRASPAGVLSYDGAVFDGAKVYYAPPALEDSVSTSCGWASGGWRIAGPSDG